MQPHYGEIVERVIRRNGHSITDVSKGTRVNRRSIYNWFNQRHLKPEIILKIGHVINHDFSVEFPDLFTSQDFDKNFVQFPAGKDHPVNVNEQDLVWKDKYITLLEQYNTVLLVNLPRINKVMV